MEKIKLNIERYKTKNPKLCQTEWQQTAKEIIQEFGIIKPYDKIVFRHAKKNLSYLKAKAINLRESAAYKGDDISTYGALLIWSLSKKNQTISKT